MGLISCVVDNGLRYPGPEDCFSPDEHFPEYPFQHVARTPNAVYRAVRRLLQQAGLDAENYGTERWNPLKQWISSGQSVFVLCNFVYHRRSGESLEEFQAKCTHASVVRAVIDYVLIAVGSNGRVLFGNAPLQSCVWPQVLKDTGAQKLEEFYSSIDAPVRSADLRLFVHERSGKLLATGVDRRSEADGITIDLGRRSLLTLLDHSGGRYRVSDYNPDRTESFHQNGSHQYVLNRRILASDVIVSIPKMKTHEKVGITCAIKGCVGAIAHKDCLAHHRRGGAREGGDEFRSDPFGVLGWFTGFHDCVQRISPETPRGRSMRFVLMGVRSLIRRLAPTINGAWSGNDTCWRMAVDIARLLSHATSDGLISPESQRPHLAFLDGVVGGEGNGPLDPTPVYSGALLFAPDPVSLDDAAARLMGYEPESLSIVREAARLTDLPLCDKGAVTLNGQCGTKNGAIINGREVSVNHLGALSEKTYRLPKGWR